MNKFKFISLSLVGFVFFLVPFTFMGQKKIAISHIINFITGNFLNTFISFTMLCAALVILGTILFNTLKIKGDFLNDVFKTSLPNQFLRVTGSGLYLMVLLNGFEGHTWSKMILNPNTGGVMAGDGGLLTTLYITFFVGLLALPLLTHFGSVEFFGILLGPAVKKLFDVPGYSAVDAIASFVGDGTIGIVVTDTQYQRGYYNRREAYIIATSFSIVGIAFASAVAEELGFSDIFPVFYGTIALITVILAMITSKLPLKKFDLTYFEGRTQNEIKIPDGQSAFSYAVSQATQMASSTSFRQVIKDAFKGVIHVYVGFLPIIMFVGTLSLIVAEYTNFFSVISAPLIPLFQFAGYSTEVASMMAPAALVGFADMYLPALFIGESLSDSSRFFIGVLAFTQLVFMSATGLVLVKSKIGLNFGDVIKVFLFRTAVSIPLLFIVTNILVHLGLFAH